MISMQPCSWTNIRARRSTSARSETAPHSTQIFPNPHLSVQLWVGKLSKSCQHFLNLLVKEKQLWQLNVLSPRMPLYGTLSLFRTSFAGCYAFPCVSLGCDVSTCKPYRFDPSPRSFPLHHTWVGVGMPSGMRLKGAQTHRTSSSQYQLGLRLILMRSYKSIFKSLIGHWGLPLIFRYVLRTEWGLCALGTQDSMEAILACIQALSTERKDLVPAAHSHSCKRNKMLHEQSSVGWSPWPWTIIDPLAMKTWVWS